MSVIRAAALAIAAVVPALAAVGDADRLPLDLELTVGIGADWRAPSAYIDHRVAPTIGFEGAILRPPRAGADFTFRGLAFGMASDLEGSHHELDAFTFAVVFGVYSHDAHDLRLSLGGSVVRAARGGDDDYASVTELGSTVAVDYRYWIRPDRRTALGARLGITSANTSVAGERRALGGGSLMVIATTVF